MSFTGCVCLCSQAAIIQDFHDLRAQAECEGLFRARPLFFCLHLGHIVLLEFLAWLVVWLWGTNWMLTSLCVVMLTTAQVTRTSSSLGRSFSGDVKLWSKQFLKCLSSFSLVPGWLAAARLWPPVCLQEVQLESRVAKVYHRPFKGDWHS